MTLAKKPRKALDLTGHKYGRLTVQSFIGRLHCRGFLWLCHCVCGNRVEATTASLRAGNTQSCGCILKEIHAARRVEKPWTPGEIALLSTEPYRILAKQLKRTQASVVAKAAELGIQMKSRRSRGFAPNRGIIQLLDKLRPNVSITANYQQ